MTQHDDDPPTIMMPRVDPEIATPRYPPRMPPAATIPTPTPTPDPLNAEQHARVMALALTRDMLQAGKPGTQLDIAELIQLTNWVLYGPQSPT